MIPSNIVKECIVVGSTTLCVACLNELQLANWKITAIVSNDPAVSSWANLKKIPCLDITEYKSRLLNTHYLFSIVNPWPLPKRILNTASALAINYHDSPLPKYAGVHSTTWAILNGELEHGITWHVMTPKIDGGAIVREAHFMLEPNETAFTLNLKCAAHALKEFKKLLQLIEEKAITFTEQTDSLRSYFELNKLLPNLGILNIHDSIIAIDRMKRSLDFWDHPNPSLTFKICINEKIYIIKKCEIEALDQNLAPGEVAELKENQLSIALKNGVIKIYQLCLLDGSPINISSLNLTESTALNNIEERTLQGLLEKNILPTDEIIKKIFDIWALLLPETAFGVDDNFFDCGGNSILLAYLQWHIEKTFPIKLSVMEFFTHPTILGMAKLTSIQLAKKP